MNKHRIATSTTIPVLSGACAVGINGLEMPVAKGDDITTTFVCDVLVSVKPFWLSRFVKIDSQVVFTKEIE